MLSLVLEPTLLMKKTRSYDMCPNIAKHFRRYPGDVPEHLSNTVCLHQVYDVLPLFMRRNHIPKFKIAFPSKVLVSSDYVLQRFSSTRFFVL